MHRLDGGRADAGSARPAQSLLKRPGFTTGRGSGAEVTWNQCQVWTFRERRIVCWGLFKDRDQALKAVGLEE